MNQSILFPDIQTWNEEKGHVSFPAQSQGALIECTVSILILERISGKLIANAEDALYVFSQYRFELEELAERLIDNEDYNTLGQIEVND